MSTAPYSAAQGRKFALTLAIAFGVLAAIGLWRGRPGVAAVFGSIGASFLIGALIFPARLEPVERAWMKLALLISKVTTPIFMGIVYFLILAPIGLIRRTAGSNPLIHKPDDNSYWKARKPVENGAARMERQF